MDKHMLNLLVKLSRIVLKDDTISLNSMSNINRLKKKYDTDLSDDDYYEDDEFVCYSPYDDNIYSVGVDDLMSEMIDALDGEW